MATDRDEIKTLAKQSIMADSFGERVQAAGLWASLQQMISELQTTATNAATYKLKRMAGEVETANEFMEKVAEAKLWLDLKQLLLGI